MILADLLASGAGVACGSGVAVAIVQGIFNRGAVKAEKVIKDHEIWYRESHSNYEVAKKEAQEAKTECAKCREELVRVRNAFYTLLEDLDEITSADPNVRSSVRIAIRAARKALWPVEESPSEHDEL